MSRDVTCSRTCPMATIDWEHPHAVSIIESTARGMSRLADGFVEGTGVDHVVPEADEGDAGCDGTRGHVGRVDALGGGPVRAGRGEAETDRVRFHGRRPLWHIRFREWECRGGRGGERRLFW